MPQPVPISIWSVPSASTVLVSSPSGSNVKGLQSILTEIRKRRDKAKLDSTAVTSVGYSAWYATFVHERTDIKHPTGQAKFLEQPLRTEEKVIADIVKRRLMARESLKNAQLAAAKHLMSVSLQLVPVKTGELKNSSFIK